MNREIAVPPALPGLLLRWYDRERRELPWRENPRPYFVWVSEVMLQQTRVEAVKPYFERFVAALPTVDALAAADETVLFKLWEGLGYYSRARNLQKAAVILREEYGGQLPKEYDALLKLPGIGEYTAGAVASIAFGKAVPAVDGNVLRVLLRISGCFLPIGSPHAKRQARERIAAVLPKDRPGDCNQALMELGAMICLPHGAPKCAVCPAVGLCAANREGLQASLPVRTEKKARRRESRTVFLFLFGGRVALRRREERGLLAGLWEFPNTVQGEEDAARSLWGMAGGEYAPFGEAKHIFTHIEWKMRGVLVSVPGQSLPPGWVWADREELSGRYPIPSAFQYFSARLLEETLL